MSYYNRIISSILAGMFIAIGCLVYTKQPNIIGAILFSFGLISVILLKLDLYTGKVGFMQLQDFLPILCILIGNLIGATFLSCFQPDVNAIIAAKFTLSPIQIFLRAYLCGMIIYTIIAVKKPIFCLIGVPLFILSGAEHSIADAAYFFAGGLTLPAINFLIIAILGNAFGSITLHRALEIKNDKNNSNQENRL